jgi:hypothetical protein
MMRVTQTLVRIWSELANLLAEYDNIICRVLPVRVLSSADDSYIIFYTLYTNITVDCGNRRAGGRFMIA